MLTGPVVINEFSYDDSGGNNRVFVELYNRSGGPVDISGWTLQGIDGTNATLNGSVVIPAGTVLSAGQFYVIGQAEAVPPVPNTGVPNVDLDVPTMNTVLETGADGLLLLDAAQSAIDGVTWEQASWTQPLPIWLEGDGLQGDIFNNDGLPQSAARVFDGYDTDDNGCDFRVTLWSPGTSNEAVQTHPPLYDNNFDDAVGTTVPSSAFSYSFVPGTTEDPVTLGIAASPQGGNCSIWYDASGGGDANYLNAQARQDWIIECYAYLRGPEATFDVDDIETWGMGVRGTTDSFAEPPDVGGLYSFIGFSFQSGMTGIAWFQVITQTTSDLYLVDFNNGGSDFTVLAGPIAVTTSGWQRLRLSAIGSDVVGNLGGTFGCDDGQRYTASNVTVCQNGVYIQYRENVSLSGGHRPIVLDALRIAPNVSAGISFAGTGSPTTVGTPVIGATGVPTLGNLAFTVDGSNLVPNGTSFAAFGLDPPVVPGTQIPGAPLGAEVFMGSIATTQLLLNSMTGTASTAVPIPCATELTNLPVTVQLIDVDFALAAMVPVGTSDAMLILVGN